MNPKNIAIMQPYIFPYVGYFCLIQASDVFVFYDDVNFITRGRINRNQVILNGEVYKFTIPLVKPSQNKIIKDVQTFQLEKFRDKFTQQVSSSYKDSKFLKKGLEYLGNVLYSGQEKISDIAITSILELYKYIDVHKEFIRSSDYFEDSINLSKADRLIDITHSLNSNDYINTMGGMKLYDKTYFKDRDINLKFINPKFHGYHQPNSKKFIPGLSIIDLVMNNSPQEILNLISDYEIL